MGEGEVTGNPMLTRSGEIIFTVALGLTATSGVQAIEPYTAQVAAPVPSQVQGPFATATDVRASAKDFAAYDVDFSRSDSRWYRYVSKRLRELGNGEHDFTGFQVPTAAVVDYARVVASRVFKPEIPTPSVVPSEDGSVLFIWHKSGWDLEIDVGGEGAAVWARDRYAGREWYGSLEELQEMVVSLLGFLAWH
jgi:hypothetical protein